jgi:hypothetical protein
MQQQEDHLAVVLLAVKGADRVCYVCNIVVLTVVQVCSVAVCCVVSGCDCTVKMEAVCCFESLVPTVTLNTVTCKATV